MDLASFWMSQYRVSDLIIGHPYLSYVILDFITRDGFINSMAWKLSFMSCAQIDFIAVAKELREIIKQAETNQVLQDKHNIHDPRKLYKMYDKGENKKLKNAMRRAGAITSSTAFTVFAGALGMSWLSPLQSLTSNMQPFRAITLGTRNISMANPKMNIVNLCLHADTLIESLVNVLTHGCTAGKTNKQSSVGQSDCVIEDRKVVRQWAG